MAFEDMWPSRCLEGRGLLCLLMAQGPLDTANQTPLSPKTWRSHRSQEMHAGQLMESAHELSHLGNARASAPLHLIGIND